jgi:hypothetical protein
MANRIMILETMIFLQNSSCKQISQVFPTNPPDFLIPTTRIMFAYFPRLSMDLSNHLELGSINWARFCLNSVFVVLNMIPLSLYHTNMATLRLCWSMLTISSSPGATLNGSPRALLISKANLLSRISGIYTSFWASKFKLLQVTCTFPKPNMCTIYSFALTCTNPNRVPHQWPRAHPYQCMTAPLSRILTCIEVLLVHSNTPLLLGPISLSPLTIPIYAQPLHDSLDRGETNSEVLTWHYQSRLVPFPRLITILTCL